MVTNRKRQADGVEAFGGDIGGEDVPAVLDGIAALECSASILLAHLEGSAAPTEAEAEAEAEAERNRPAR